MRIIIVGAGLVGSTLATYLAKGGYDVAVIDNDLKSLNDISEKLDILSIYGNGVNPSVLESAGIKDAEILIAATPIDELNIVVCGIGQIYKVPKRFARIRNDELASQLSEENLKKLGVTKVIQPETAVVNRILQFIDTPGVTEAANFHNDTLLLRGIKITEDMSLANKELKKVRELMPNEIFLIVAVIREGIGFIPLGDSVLKPGDIAIIAYSSKSRDLFLLLTNKNNQSVSKVVVSGNSLIGKKLCHALEEKHIDQILWLNSDKDFAMKSASELKYTEVIDGDGMEVDVLREIQVGFADFYLSVDDNTEDNIMSALLAKSIGAKETLTISNEPRFNDLFQSIGISHVISPRIVTAEEIMTEIQRGHFGLVMRLGQTDLDVIHLVVGENSTAASKPLEKVWKMVKAKFLIATIIRNDEIFIPQGKSVIEAGDDILIVTKSKNRHTLQKLFKAR